VAQLFFVNVFSLLSKVKTISWTKIYRIVGPFRFF